MKLYLLGVENARDIHKKKSNAWDASLGEK